ncbi:uncharacterized protein VDAG_02422 [Verticillium dahliae VdLs.17]|uniref:Uncharacterized protein n=1 Tax=Verticillium dahliae (strain VdLs.17 / ATCC MYA-4575 / FGSC 10137) TaxID=498257 RepID=G2WXU0_VERDV|nr:uncharacterized protein VDAG_02422 [Verticillium dahliae VdLs.17]EGY20898.1 hypothetical protein VDAG_02422 [Verticillium dahliae VdLs.17]
MALNPPKPPQLSGSTTPSSIDPAFDDETSTDESQSIKHIIEDVKLEEDSVQFYIGGHKEAMTTRRMHIAKRSWNVQVSNMDKEENINRLAETVERDRRAVAAETQRRASTETPTKSTSFAGIGRITGSGGQTPRSD